MFILNHFLYTLFIIIGIFIKLNETGYVDDYLKLIFNDDNNTTSNKNNELCDILNCKIMKCLDNGYNVNNLKEKYCCSKCFQLTNRYDKTEKDIEASTETEELMDVSKLNRKQRSVDDSDEATVSTEKCQNIDCSYIGYSYYKLHSNCPNDTFKIEATTDEMECCSIEYKCECKNCSTKPDCILPGAGEIELMLVRKGNNTPNSCCDLYVCTSKNFDKPKSTCHHNGVFHADQAKWKPEECMICTCNKGIVVCEEEKCPNLTCEIRRPVGNSCCRECTGECHSLDYEREYKNGESWTEKDDCTHCTCKDGHKYCHSESCSPVSCKNPIKKPGVCCRYCKEEDVLKIKYPPHCSSIISNLNCNLTCEFGRKLNGNRCPTCECNEKPIEKCPFACESDLLYLPLNDRLCKCTQQCSNECNIVCPYGYKNVNGCDTCKCNEIPLQHTLTCNGQIGKEQYEGSIWFDGCRQCICYKNHQYCSLIACNIQCTKPIYRPDMCCPICSEDDVTSKLELPNITICYSPKNGKIYSENDTFYLDECTMCICKNGIVLCHINDCPANSCQKPTYSKNQSCCQNCLLSDQFKVPAAITNEQTNEKFWSCFDSNDHKKHHGSTWKENDCLHCKCINGESKCYSEICPKTNCVQKVFKKGQCCPYCLENITSPYLLSNTVNTFTTTSTIAPTPTPTPMVTTIILIVLICLVIFLILIVIVLLTYILRNNNQDSSTIQITGFSNLPNSNEQDKVFNKPYSNDDEDDCPNGDLNRNKNKYIIDNTSEKKSKNKFRKNQNRHCDKKLSTKKFKPKTNGHLQTAFADTNGNSTLSPLIKANGGSTIYYV